MNNIQIITGDIFESEAEALVNPVNTVGVMGKGLALEFKKRYPKNYKKYKQKCDDGNFRVGFCSIVKENEKIIVNFPTKNHWRYSSRMSYITDGLKHLIFLLKKYNIESITIPPLGCGLGGLDWNEVKKLIINTFENEEIKVFIYKPI